MKTKWHGRGRDADVLSSWGPLLSLVTVFFSLDPLQMSVRRAFLPCCSARFKDGFSVLAWNTCMDKQSQTQIQSAENKPQTVKMTSALTDRVLTQQKCNFYRISLRGERSGKRRVVSKLLNKMFGRSRFTYLENLQAPRWEEGEAPAVVVGEAGLASSWITLLYLHWMTHPGGQVRHTQYN